MVRPDPLVGPLTLRALLTREPLDDEFVAGVVDLLLRGLTRRGPDDGHHGPDRQSRAAPTARLSASPRLKLSRHPDSLPSLARLGLQAHVLPP
jgi:hypothetical protein